MTTMVQARAGVADQTDWRVYFVTDTGLAGGVEAVASQVEAAVMGGAGVVQVRDKTLPDDAFTLLTRACVAANERVFERTGRRARIVVNDRLPVAATLRLDFHQGQDDGDITLARELLGDEALIGLSISSMAELEAELAEPTADVLGLSPIWGTPTKTDTAAELGLEGARRVVEAASGRFKTVGIGGINASNAREVIATGVDGICVVSAIASAPDPRRAAADLLALWDRRP